MACKLEHAREIIKVEIQKIRNTKSETHNMKNQQIRKYCVTFSVLLKSAGMLGNRTNVKDAGSGGIFWSEGSRRNISNYIQSMLRKYALFNHP